MHTDEVINNGLIDFRERSSESLRHSLPRLLFTHRCGRLKRATQTECSRGVNIYLLALFQIPFFLQFRQLPPQKNVRNENEGRNKTNTQRLLRLHQIPFRRSKMEAGPKRKGNGVVKQQLSGKIATGGKKSPANGAAKKVSKAAAAHPKAPAMKKQAKPAIPDQAKAKEAIKRKREEEVKEEQEAEEEEILNEDHSEDENGDEQDGVDDVQDENKDQDEEAESAEDVKKEPVSFADLGVIPEICDSCNLLGWSKPTDIQKETIPLALQGIFSLLFLIFKKTHINLNYFIIKYSKKLI